MKRFRQFDRSDCGAACLATVASHFGISTSLTALRERAGTDRNGVTLKGLIDAAETIGLEARAYHDPQKRLQRTTPVPLIAHVIRDDRLHFVVVLRIGRKRVTLFDPALGHERLLHPDFAAIWTGYVLMTRRAQQLDVPSSPGGGLLRRFLPFLSPHRSTLVFAGVASLILTLLGIASAWYFRFLVDEVLSIQHRLTLHVATGGVMALALVRAALRAVRGRMMLAFSTKFDLNL